MPIYKFECENCERPFEELVKMGTKKSACPRCGFVSPKSPEIQPTAVITRDNVDSTALSQKDIDKRVGQASEEAWEAHNAVTARRRKAQRELGTSQVFKRPDGDPSSYEKMASDDVATRRKIENIMKAEPQENLDKAGIQMIRKKEPKAPPGAEGS